MPNYRRYTCTCYRMNFLVAVDFTAAPVSYFTNYGGTGSRLRCETNVPAFSTPRISRLINDERCSPNFLRGRESDAS